MAGQAEAQWVPLCLGKGFATELEAVICVQQFLLAELEQVNRELQYTHHLPHTHTSATSASTSTDPCAQEEALDEPARTDGDVQPPAGSPFLYLPALRRSQQEAESLDRHSSSTHHQYSRFLSGDMVTVAATCGNYVIIRNLPNGRCWLPCAYTHGQSAKSTAQHLVTDIGLAQAAHQLEELGTHAVKNAQHGLVYVKCFGVKMKKISEPPADQFSLQWYSITDFFTSLAGSSGPITLEKN